MSFFFKAPTNAKDREEFPSRIVALNEGRCEVCPMQEGGRCKSLQNPYMSPGGSEQAEIYVLAEAPGRDEDGHGTPLIGVSGQLMRRALYRVLAGESMETRTPSFGKLIRYTDSFCRFNNVIRCHPENNRDPTWQEVEACRRFIIEDIESCKPTIILGTGNIPLRWMTGETGILSWRGKMLPVQVGSHACWYMPLYHPAYVYRAGGEEGETYPVFLKDLSNALKNSISTPIPETRIGKELPDIYKGVELFHGYGKSALEKNALIAKLWRMVRSLADEKLISLDIETNGLRPYVEGSKILSIAVGTHEKIASIAVDHPQSGWSLEQRKKIQSLLFWMLSSEFKPLKIAHNLQFEAEWFGYYFGQEVLEDSEWGCSLAQAYVLGHRRQSLGLDDLCLQSFGVPLKSLSNVDVKRLAKCPIEDVLRYNSLDTKWTYPLFQVQREELERDDLVGLYDEQIQRVVAAVFMQLGGVPLDRVETRTLDTQLLESIEEIHKGVNRLPIVKEYVKDKEFKEFNLKSPKQVLEVLRDYYKRSEVRDNRTGKYSTKEEILKEIDSPFANRILRHRGLSKLHSTYVQGFMPGGKYYFPDGHMHPIFNPNRTYTRRLASSDPNGQNFPSGDKSYIRRQITAGSGKLMVCIDYGQIEARVIAMYSKDQFLIKALHGGYDIHMDWTKTLAEEFPLQIGGRENLDNPKAMKRFRTRVKNEFVFPLFYGADAWSCLGYLGLPKYSKPALTSIVKDFWKTFAAVKKWQEAQVREYEHNLEIVSLEGFRFPAPLTRNQVFNYPIQGSASNITVGAMVELHKEAYQTGEPELRPVLNIHDDLSFIISEKNLEEYVAFIIGVMLKPRYDYINVPINLEATVGPNWFEQEPFGEFSNADWKF